MEPGHSLMNCIEENSKAWIYIHKPNKDQCKTWAGFNNKTPTEHQKKRAWETHTEEKLSLPSQRKNQATCKEITRDYCNNFWLGSSFVHTKCTLLQAKTLHLQSNNVQPF